MVTEKGHHRGVRKDSWRSESPEGKSFREDSMQMDDFEWKGPEHFTNLDLFMAINRGDLQATKHFLDQQPDALTTSLTQDNETPLHKAVLSGHKKIVREIVRRIRDPKALETKNNSGATSLIYAAAGGIVGIAECLVNKCSGLVSIGNEDGQIPVVVASLYGHKDLVRYLYSVTPLNDLDPSDDEDENKGKNGAMLVTTCIIDGLYDIALELISYYPKLAYTRDHDNDIAIMALAQTPSAFPSGTVLASWQWWIYACIPMENRHEDPNHNPRKTGALGAGQRSLQEKLLKFLKFLFPHTSYIYELKLQHVLAIEILNRICRTISNLDASQLQNISLLEALFKAVENGIVEYVEELMKRYPDIVWYRDRDKRNIFFCAVSHRQEKIFNLIYKLRAKKNILANSWDRKYNNMLHQAAFQAPASQLNRVPGAALQMQRELQWFKEVESLVQPKNQKMVNLIQKKTPQELFTDEHKDLVEKGESWMKETAESCSVVAALIATMMFSSAFTIPGGFTDQGVPIFLRRKSFMLFIISDAISLFTSCISLLMFLGILRSRYREEDFLRSLPTKLIVGLASLFLSMASMMVTFVVTLTILLSERVSWVSAPAVLLAMVPVAMFAALQFPVLLEICYSTYGPGIFHKPRKFHRLSFARIFKSVR